MSKLLAEFHDYLLPELPGCTVAMVNLHLVQVAREFCHSTSAWRLPLDPIGLVAGQKTYDLDAPELQADPVRLTKMTVAGVLLWQYADARPVNRADTPKYQRNKPPFTVSNDLTEITLAADEVPAATLVADMLLEGAFKPSITATALPDFLRSQYLEAMRFGTLSRLMVMKKKWGDRDLAMRYASEWHSALNFAAYQADVGNTRQPLRVRSYG